MKNYWLSVSIACAAAMAPLPASARGTSSGPVLYEVVAPQSEFAWGCFGPCACPLIVQSEIAGTFVVSPSHADPQFSYYDVSDVRWTVRSASGPVAITGAGTYRRGGEFALTEELALDLSFGQGPVQHFYSGLVPVAAPFPEIRAELALHRQFCFDSVLVVDAKPIGLASVDSPPRGLSLVVGPNPSAATAEAVFMLPREAIVDLGVFDLAGRRVRALVTHERLASGTHARAWDGRRDDGARVPPGLYLLRLDTPGGRLTRTAVRVH